MRRATRSQGRGPSRCALLVFLVLSLLTGGLVLAQPAQALDADGDMVPPSPPIIGINIGNSHSSVGFRYLENDTIQIIPDKYGNLAIPSVVSFKENGEAVVGYEALDILYSHPERSITGLRRLFSRYAGHETTKYDTTIADSIKGAYHKIVNRVTGPAAQIPLESGSKLPNPMETLSLVIRELKAMAEDFIGEEIEKAIITVPAGFDDAQRQATRDAAEMAGISAERIMNEATGAAVVHLPEDKWVCYGANCKPDFILVYGLDGTAFDATVVESEEGVLEILGYVRAENISKNGLDVDTTWRSTCSRSNPQLDLSDSFSVDQVLDVVNRAIRDANVSIWSIRQLIPMGGVSCIPELGTEISALFPSKVPIRREIDPVLVATYGAAKVGWILRENEWRGCPGMDVNVMTLGVENAGGMMSHMIKRGTTVPTKKSRLFTTTTDNQTSVAVNIFQGEQARVADNMEIGKIQLDGITPSAKGAVDLEIMFEISASHSLNVTVIDLATNKSKSLFMESYGWVQDGNIEALEAHIEEAEIYAEEDSAIREQIEERIMDYWGRVLNTGIVGIMNRPSMIVSRCMFEEPAPEYGDEPTWWESNVEWRWESHLAWRKAVGVVVRQAGADLGNMLRGVVAWW